MAMNIERFYQDRSVFVTGGTGFIGKVLIEKLLSSCPGIKTIYLLIRPSRDGTPPQQRLQADLLQSRAFTFRNAALDLSKLVAVSGDLTKPGLGMSDEDRQMLLDNVSVVFHSAATVRFNGPLKKFIEQNVIGTQQVMTLCQSMKYLQAIVYVSTAYANCNLDDVEEKIYPIGVDVDKLIENVCKVNSEVAPEEGDPQLIGRPNPYTFSKAIAECMINEKFADLPIVICRPSIVTHAYKDPVDGWCDSLNGVAGLLLLGGLGIARTMEINCNYKSDIIPVDFVANSLIVIGYHTSQFPEQRNQVVHLTSGQNNPITWGQILDNYRESAVRAPSVKLIRPIASNPSPSRSIMNRMHYTYVIIVSHLLFAYFFDFLLTLLRRRRFLVGVTKKMHRSFDVLRYFTNREWTFRYQNYYKILNSLPSNEQIMFESNVSGINWNHYCNSLYMGSRRYLLNEDDSTVEKGRVQLRKVTTIFKLLNWSRYLFALIGIFAFIGYVMY